MASQVHPNAQGLVAGVHLEDGPTPAHVRRAHEQPTVKSSGAQKSRVEHVGTVGGPNDEHSRRGVETVHLQ